ncbi:MBL fold metallo-hydrolase [bacterium]|nr:MBL fold metallo-hydrolase [bacterium]
MILKTFVTGMLENNNYLLIDETSKEAVLIDCSEYLDEIKDVLYEHHANLKYVLVTHGHFDHVFGINDLHENFPNTIIIAPAEDKDLIEDIETFLDRYIGGMGNVKVPHIDKYVSEKDELTIGNKKIQIISTPGHTKGGVCYFADDKLFSGDTIFLGCVGRTDLPGGNYEQIRKSVNSILEMFEDDITIYPGHGPSTSVGYEKVHNPVI